MQSQPVIDHLRLLVALPYVHLRRLLSKAWTLVVVAAVRCVLAVPRAVLPEAVWGAVAEAALMAGDGDLLQALHPGSLRSLQVIQPRLVPEKHRRKEVLWHDSGRDFPTAAPDSPAARAVAVQIRRS